jgi:hypothetical protein
MADEANISQIREGGTDEPVNLGVVKVLNTMDDLVKVYNSKYDENLNWRVMHRLKRSAISSRRSSMSSLVKTSAARREPASPEAVRM